MAEDKAARDYLQDALLYGIYSYENSRALVFKGGTALRKVYSLDRYSDDIDFSLDETKLSLPVPKFIHALRDHTVAALSPSYNARIYFHRISSKAAFVQYNADAYISDMQGNSATIELNVRLAKIYLATEEKRITTPRVTYFANAMNIDEILAEKVRAIFTRRNINDMVRDVVDLDYIKNIGGVARKEIIEAKLREDKITKLSFKRLKSRLDAITDKTWSDGLSDLMARIPNKAEMIKSVEELLQNVAEP